MEFFPDLKTVVSFGSLSITWYAVFILTGALLAYYFTYRNFKKRGYDVDILEDAFFGILIWAIIGARVWFILFSDLQGYLADPIRMLDFREGGLAIHGGIIFAVIYAIRYVRKQGFTFLRLADEAFYHVLLAQALGRWGNFTNQEAFGGIVEASYYEGWPSFIRDTMFIGGEYRQPTFLFESVLNVIGWTLIHFGLRKTDKYKEGDLVWAYLLWYGVVRFFIEGMRTDSLYFFNFRIAQLVSLVMIVIGLLGFLGVYRKIFKAKKPTLIFDFDGTIANTEPIILQVFKEIFADYPELELTEEDYQRMVGPTLEQTFQKYLPNEDIDALVERYRVRNKELHPEMIEAMPNVKETLEALKSQGYKLGIVSNKKTDMIDYGLELLEMGHLFDKVLGSDLVEEPKPNSMGITQIIHQLGGTRDNLIYVGDTRVDMETGVAANAFTIAYNLDDNKRSELEKQQPNRVLHDWNELLEIVKEDRLWIYNTK